MQMKEVVSMHLEHVVHGKSTLSFTIDNRSSFEVGEKGQLGARRVEDIFPRLRTSVLNSKGTSLFENFTQSVT